MEFGGSQFETLAKNTGCCPQGIEPGAKQVTLQSGIVDKEATSGTFPFQEMTGKAYVGSLCVQLKCMNSIEFPQCPYREQKKAHPVRPTVCSPSRHFSQAIAGIDDSRVPQNIRKTIDERSMWI
eukprot:m.292112 g.292112  ORF g.292112 m.292112 type:complete len:124 (-) comp16385_c0_seq33:492-863(-)